MTEMAFHISSAAAQRIAALIALESSEISLRFRISVSGGGCSGFQYAFNLDPLTTSDDLFFPKDGIEVVIDSISLSLISESTLDFTEDLTAAKFVIRNPNATASCGCGNSFAL